MTEDEARLTRCCGPEGCGGNSANEADRYCIASACMAWRYRESPEFKAKADRAYQRDGAVMKLNEGFCGLAGQP